MVDFILPRYMFEEDPDEDFEDVKVPGKWEICDRCGGDGHRDNPAFSNGITASEWNGPDWDYESQQNYLNGRYDVSCDECGGSGKVVVINEDYVDADLVKRYREYMEEKARQDWEDGAERRYFARFEDRGW